MYKEPAQVNNKKPRISQKWMVDLIRHHQDYIQMANNYLKMCSRTSVTGEHRLKPQYLPHTRLEAAVRAALVAGGEKRDFPMAQMVKNLPAKQDTWLRTLRWEDPLEKDVATPSSVLVWRIRWTEEPGVLQSEGSQRVRHD